MLRLRNHSLKVFLQYLSAAIAANSENSSGSHKLSVSDRDSEGHEAVVSDMEV